MSAMTTISPIEALLRQPAAQAVGWALLQFAWQGALIGALAAIALAALGRSAADVRYIIGTIGLALMLTLPVVTGAQKFQVLRAGHLAASEIQLVAARPGSGHVRSSLPVSAPAPSSQESSSSSLLDRVRAIPPMLAPGAGAITLLGEALI